MRALSFALQVGAWPQMISPYEDLPGEGCLQQIANFAQGSEM
jgi:hypothetical protein